MYSPNYNAKMKVTFFFNDDEHYDENIQTLADLKFEIILFISNELEWLTGDRRDKNEWVDDLFYKRERVTHDRLTSEIFFFDISFDMLEYFRIKWNKEFEEQKWDYKVKY